MFSKHKLHHVSYLKPLLDSHCPAIKSKTLSVADRAGVVWTLLATQTSVWLSQLWAPSGLHCSLLIYHPVPSTGSVHTLLPLPVSSCVCQLHLFILQTSPLPLLESMAQPQAGPALSSHVIRHLSCVVLITVCTCTLMWWFSITLPLDCISMKASCLVSHCSPRMPQNAWLWMAMTSSLRVLCIWPRSVGC